MKNVPKALFFLFTSLFVSECICEITRLHSSRFHIALCIGLAAFFYLIWDILRWIKPFGKNLIDISERPPKRGRKVGGDIIRTVAVLFVPYLHFFGQSGYYNTILTDKYMLATAVRWLTVCAVPIFMIITGYFKSEKKLDVWHYKAIFPILLTHIIVSGIRIWVDMKFHGIAVDAEYIKHKMLYFEYGWYIRLYIGILILLPFFNAVFEKLETRKKRELFVLTLCSLGFLGPLTMDIVPSSWLILYVFGYYSIGLYIHKYKITINPIINIITIAFFIAITTLATHAHSNGHSFDWNYFGYAENSGYSAFPVVVVSALLMILCVDIELPPALAIIFRLFEMVSLEMYLYSQMFDSFIYPYYEQQGYRFSSFFSHSLIIVGSSVALAFIASHITAVITRLIRLPFGLIFNYIFKRNKSNSKAKEMPSTTSL